MNAMMALQLGGFVALVLAGLVLFLRYFAGVGAGAPYLPIRRRYVEAAFAKLEIGPETRVMDLGSGDGRILLEAAKRGASVAGYELNPLLAWISRRRLARFKSRAKIYRRNLFTADLSDADVIFVFGITGIMPRLSRKILAEAPERAVIVSFAFRMPELLEFDRAEIAFFYRVPSREKL